MKKHELTPVLQTRDFGGLIQQPDVRWTIQGLSWDLPGGPREATLGVTGSAASVYALIDALRCPIEMQTEHGDAQWWGYVHEARIKTGTYEIGATLDSMANKVKLAYTQQSTGVTTVGGRQTTGWSEDAESIADFGTKEFLASGGNLSSATAAARLGVILGSMSRPQQTAFFSRSGGKAAAWTGEVSGTIKCRGWWQTLNWRYAVIGSVAGAGYTTTSATEQAVGSASTNTKVAQIFNLSGRAMACIGLRVYARKVGSPTDNLLFELYEVNDSDVPTGSALGTVTTAGSGMSTSLGWVTGNFSENQMKPNKDYALVVSRSGAASGTNYYAVNVNTSLGDSSGFLRIWNGSAWVARSTDADLVYAVDVDNYVETTSQVWELATTFGQFLSGVEIEEDSGVMQPSYRDGDTLAGGEIEDLLKTGGANGRALLATVSRDRRLLVWEEPASTSTAYRITGDGVLTDALGVALTDLNPPLGNWVRLDGLVPESADVSKLIAPNKQFLEGASWSPQAGLVPKFRGRPSIEDMFRVMR